MKSSRLHTWATALGRWSRTPATRLTAAYVLILALLSLCFSAVLYHFAVNQLAQGLGHQYNAIRYAPNNGGAGRPMPFDPSNIPAPVEEYLDAAKHGLVLSLIYFNLIIVALGSSLSYWLAKRTLRPIEVALEAQSRFTADASHELRTPLAVMQTEIEIARADPGLTKAAALELLDSNLEEAKKLHALSEGLLRLARSDKDTVALLSTPLDDILSDAIDRVSSRAAARSITLVNDSTVATVQADAGSLTELIVILLDNAIKYSPSSSTVTLSTMPEGHNLRLSVTDQGRGIAPEDLPHIFERFYRVDSSRTTLDVEGHGLGLSIAAQIARINQTQIAVKSEAGHGAIFSLLLKTKL